MEVAAMPENRRSGCPACDNSAAISVAYEICVQNAGREKCDLVRDRLIRGEIQTIEELIAEFKKVTPEKAHPLLDEILAWMSEQPEV